MTFCFSLYIILGTVCVSLLSAETAEFSVSGPVGSTAVLPCDMTGIQTIIRYIKWEIQSKRVFRRADESASHGEGYEGRVDVTKEELSKENCSLVLRNLRLNDTGVYTSQLSVRPTKEDDFVRIEYISRVNLSVYDDQNNKADGSDTQQSTAPTIEVFCVKI